MSHADSAKEVVYKEYRQTLKEYERQKRTDSLSILGFKEKRSSYEKLSADKKVQLERMEEQARSKRKERSSQQLAELDSLRKIVRGSPVTGSFGDTLFIVYNKLGSFSAEDRARAISERIAKVAENYTSEGDSLYLSRLETSVDVMYGPSILLSVTEVDAQWNLSSMDSLARKYCDAIQRDLAIYKSETKTIVLLKEAGTAVLILGVLGVLILLVNRFFKWLRTELYQRRENYLQGIKIKNYTLISPRYQAKVLLSVGNFLKWILIALLVYLTLPLLFGLFPWTRDYTQLLLGYVLHPIYGIGRAIIDYFPNLVTIIVIAVFFRYVLKGLHFLKTEIEKESLIIPGFYSDWANPTFQIMRVLIIAFFIVVVFPFLPGNDSRVFQGVSVFLGFLFTFSSASSLSNMVSGLVLTYMRLYKLGDRVKIGEISGDVIEKSLLVTRIRTIKNEIITIPNSSVMAGHTINYSAESLEAGLIIHTTLTLGYDLSWRKVHEALIEAALRTDLVLKNPTPFVLQTSLDDFYVSYQLNAYIREANKQAVIYSQLHQHLQDVCNENGIEILSPHYRAARDGNMTTIPFDYLPKDYSAPTFHVKVEDKNRPRE